MREKLFAGDISAAGDILGRSFRYADGVSGWRDIDQFGSYQTLGDLILDFDDKHASGIYTWDYLHELGAEQDQIWNGYLGELAEKGLIR